MGYYLDSAMRDAVVTKKDARGLMPLDEARAIVARSTSFGSPTSRFDREEDALWAALCSLEDAGEFVREASRLTWVADPRGTVNIAFYERYGDAILPWIERFFDPKTGTLTNAPWCVQPCLLEVGTPRALELVLHATTLVRPDYTLREPEMFLGRWFDKHAKVGWPELARRALAGEARAKEVFKSLIKGRSGSALATIEAALGKDARAEIEKTFKVTARLEVADILAVLDAKASDASDVKNWPRFNHDFEDTLEYVALRLVAARDAGDKWCIVLERISGGDPDHFSLQTFAYGSEISPGMLDDEPSLPVEITGDAQYDAETAVGSSIKGPAGDFTPSEDDLKTLKLKPGEGCEPESGRPPLVLLRGYLAKFPGTLWPKVEETLARVGMPREPPTLIVSEEFQHVTGSGEGRDGALPSTSKTYKSLADALVKRDPARFVPGKSNLDWRKHLAK